MKRNLKMSNEVIKRILLSNREYHGAGRENGDGLYIAGYQHSSEVIFLPPPASVDSCFCLYRNTCTNNTLLLHIFTCLLRLALFVLALFDHICSSAVWSTIICTIPTRYIHVYHIKQHK